MRRILLELDADGEVRGFTDGPPAEVSFADGSTRFFGPGASIDGLPARAAPIFGEATERSGPSVVLQLLAFNLFALRDRVATQFVKGRVYWWPEGEVLRDEHEIYRGEVRGPAWNLAPDGAGSVSFTLAAPTRTADVPFPPAAIGDEGRFPDAPDRGRTQAVPVIYGTVRGLPLYPVGPTAGPGVVRLIVAGHRIVSTSVDVARDGAVVSGGEPVLYAIDGLGGWYAYVEIAAAVYGAGDSLYLAEVTGWAAPDGQPVERLGDVLLHAWTTYAGERFYELDRRRVHAARVPLNRFRVGFYVNEVDANGTVLRTLSARLGGQFPVIFGFAGGRFGWDSISLLDEPRARPARSIVYGQDCFGRDGPTETSVEDILTEFEVSYLTDAFQGGTVASQRADRENNGDCRAAVSRWGAAPKRRIDAPDCPDSDTAYALLTDQVKRYTVQRDRVAYLGCDPELYDLPLLEEVLVTDPDAGWINRPFLLESAAPRTDGRCDVGLVSKYGTGRG